MYVIDTSALISYFSNVFNQPSQISSKSLEIMNSAICNGEPKLVIPNVVFIEIYAKFFINDEEANKIRYEIYEVLKQCENISFFSLENEVLENFIKIINIESDHNFDNHDKQVLATAMMLNVPLITSDLRLIRYNRRNSVVPEILS